MALSTIWWLLAGMAVIAELLTGTLYLLMVAIGMVAAALAAHLGAGTTVQILVAAAVSAATVLACYARQRQRSGQQAAQAARDMLLDIGEQVHVERWSDDRTAQVRYRGAPWTASLLSPAAPVAGSFRVVRLEGNCLMVEPAITTEAPHH